jgi:hypothetical protein
LFAREKAGPAANEIRILGRSRNNPKRRSSIEPLYNRAVDSEARAPKLGTSGAGEESILYEREDLEFLP